jgi:hypothetical protein
VNLGLVGIIIFLLPSVFFLKDNISDKDNRDRIQHFITKGFPEDSLTTVRWELIRSDSINIVKVVYQGSVIEGEKINEYTSKFDSLKIPNTRLQIVQPNINKGVVDHLAKTIDNLKDRTVDAQTNPEGTKAAVKEEIRQKFSEIRKIDFKTRKDESMIAELEWRRARIFIRSRKHKLKGIKELLQNRLGSEVTVVEI